MKKNLTNALLCILLAFTYSAFSTCFEQYNCMEVFVDASDTNAIEICVTSKCDDYDFTDQCTDPLCTTKSCNDPSKAIEIAWSDINSDCSTRYPTFLWPFRLSKTDFIFATCKPSIDANQLHMCQNNGDSDTKCIWKFSIDYFCQTAYPTLEPTPKPTKTTTLLPTKYPTTEPTPKPITPTTRQNPTRYTTDYPTIEPTPKPTKKPSTNNPTDYPTTEPTPKPTRNPITSTTKTTAFPTIEPTPKPTRNPIANIANRCTQRESIDGVAVRCGCFSNGCRNNPNNNEVNHNECRVVSGNECQPQYICCCSALDATAEESCNFNSAMNAMNNWKQADHKYALIEHKTQSQDLSEKIIYVLTGLFALILGCFAIIYCVKKSKKTKKGYMLASNTAIDEDHGFDEGVDEVEITALK